MRAGNGRCEHSPRFVSVPNLGSAHEGNKGKVAKFRSDPYLGSELQRGEVPSNVQTIYESWSEARGVGSAPGALEHHVVSSTTLGVEQRCELRLPCAICHPSAEAIPGLDNISPSSFVRSWQALLLNIGAWHLINARCAGMEAKSIVLKSTSERLLGHLYVLDLSATAPSCCKPPSALSGQYPIDCPRSSCQRSGLR